jgi:ketosteroid isomerase-like protein
LESVEAVDALEAFRRYTRAFQALDARAVAQHFHEPALLITPKEALTLATRADVEQAYGRIMADLPKDYAGTEFFSLSEQRLGDDLSRVSGSGTWKDASNRDLMPFGMTYLLRRTGDSWRIITVAIHAPFGAGQ